MGIRQHGNYGTFLQYLVFFVCIYLIHGLFKLLLIMGKRNLGRPWLKQ